MCKICKTSDGGQHHYYCPFGDGNVLDIVSKEEAELKYKSYFKWQRDDGLVYIMETR